MPRVHNCWKTANNFERNTAGQWIIKNMAFVDVSSSRKQALASTTKLYVSGHECKNNPDHNHYRELVEGEIVTKVGCIRQSDGHCKSCAYGRVLEAMRAKKCKDEGSDQEESFRKGRARRRIEALKEAREAGIDINDLY